jgi:hypothetical protein
VLFVVDVVVGIVVGVVVVVVVVVAPTSTLPMCGLTFHVWKDFPFWDNTNNNNNKHNNNNNKNKNKHKNTNNNIKDTPNVAFAISSSPGLLPQTRISYVWEVICEVFLYMWRHTMHK